MGSWWATEYYNAYGPNFLIAWCLWIIVAICLHELAHGWAAISRGDQTPIHTGHMTWNPLVHMGMYGVIFFIVLGISAGSMPIDPTRLRGRYASAWVAFAGPLMNILLCVICLIVGGIALKLGAPLSLTGEGIPQTDSTAQFLNKLWLFAFIGAVLNLCLAIFNLLPFPPLDGSKILANFVSPYERFLGTQNGMLLAFAGFILSFMLVGRVLYPFALETSLRGMMWISGWMPLSPIVKPIVP